MLVLKVTKDVVLNVLTEVFRETACEVMDEYEIVRDDGSICSIEDEDNRLWYGGTDIMNEFLKKVSFLAMPSATSPKC